MNTTPNVGLNEQIEHLNTTLKALDEAILYYSRYKGKRGEPREIGRGDTITDTLANVRTEVSELEKLRYSQWQAYNTNKFWTGAVFFVNDEPDNHFYCMVSHPDKRSNIPYITSQIYDTFFKFRFKEMRFATNSVGYEIAIVTPSGRRVGVIQPSAKKEACQKWNRENGILPKGA